MINYKIIINIIGLLLIVESIFMTFGLSVSLLYEGEDITAFIYSIIITLTSGLLLKYTIKPNKTKFGKREGYIIVSFSWAIFSIFGALPFYFNQSPSSFTDCYFETISGFTTTGASILNDIESLPNGLLFWRSMTQWLGGMGFIVLSLAILPFLGIGGMQLFVAEVPGPTPDKLHPKVRETAKRLWMIYLILTFSETMLLLFGGMPLFDSICHSFTTMATGGYSTKQASIAFYDSAYIQYIITFFMFLAGINFTLTYYLFHGKLKPVVKNEEFKFYFLFILFFIIIISIGLLNFNNYDIEKSFRDAAFQVVSIITTTGFATTDYLLWPASLWSLIFIMMFLGGSAGSTGGGIKIVRIVLVLKNSISELKRLIHPNAIIPVRFNHKAVQPSIVTNIIAFVVFYGAIFLISVLIMAFLGYDFETSMGSVAASLGNIGPGIGKVGPAENFAFFSDPAKWFLSFLMLVGRLELFTVLVLFSPAFWKK